MRIKSTKILGLLFGFDLILGLVLPTAAYAGFFDSKTVTSLPDIATLVENHSNAVVNISTTSKPKVVRGPHSNGQIPSPFEGTPFEQFFEDFFRQLPQQQARPEQSLGSGVIISADGYVVTNNHVVRHADDIVVRLNDETEYSAKLIGADSKNDLALLKIDANASFGYAELGNSDAVRVGDWVVAIGNPFGLGGTVTTGIISARGRHIGQGPYDDFFQTDAAINPGNSGGPLFNLKGDVIGINTAILTRSGGNQGIGFAIPSNTVRSIIEQIKEHGRPIRGWLGVRIQNVTKNVAEALGLDKSRGALVASIVEDSPAQAAGVEVGDVILAYDGKDIAEMSDLPRLVAATSVGTKADLLVLRAGKEITLKATIAELKEENTQEAETLQDEEKDDGFGLQLGKVTDAFRAQYGLSKEEKGVAILGVLAGSGAQHAGIRVGDVLLRVGQSTVNTVKEAQEALEEVKGDTVLLLMSRQGQNLFVPVRREP